MIGARFAPDGRTRVPPRGLPEHLPEGERLLWQGAPEWRAFARHALHIRGLAVYFGVILACSAAASLLDGAGAADAAVSTLLLTLVALVPIGLLMLYAWLVSRATTYSITSRRVVLRLGIALPVTINLPFARIESASMRLRGDGTGDLCLLLDPEDRLAYLVLWPHARPWRMARSEPALRAIPDAGRVGQLLAQALAGTPVAAAPSREPAPDLGEARPRTAVAA